MPERQYGFYNGKEKDSAADVIFASIFTLSMKSHLERFQPDEFDLIIVDEFHHAAADSYKRALDYFKPKFLLGITATPDRNDNKDVYALCDGNVAFRLDFLDAIQRKWLAPFKYYGVYDDTDYSQITWLGTRYDEEELLKAQMRDDLAEKIFQAWKDKKQTRTLGFCSSIKQANFLSNYFIEKFPLDSGQARSELRRLFQLDWSRKSNIFFGSIVGPEEKILNSRDAINSATTAVMNALGYSRNDEQQELSLNIQA